MNIWKSKKVTVQVEGSVNAILPATYEIVPPMTAPTTFPASNVILADAGNRYTATEVETALQEIAGSGRTTETVKSVATSVTSAISNLGGTGRTTETIKENSSRLDDISPYLEMYRKLGVVQGSNGSVNIIGDSIAEGFGVATADEYATLLSKKIFEVNGTTDYETNVNFDALPSDISFAGTYALGTKGPCKKSMVLQIGAVITIIRSCSYLDFFYYQDVGAGKLQVRANGTLYKTIDCAGTTELDACSFPTTISPITAGLSATYTVTVIDGAVELTGITCLNSSTNAIRCNRFALNATSTADYVDTPTLASIYKVAAMKVATPKNLFIIALGTNEIFSVSKQLSAAGYRANLLTMIQYLRNAGQIVVLVVPPVANAAPIIEPHTNYKVVIYDLASQFDLNVIDFSSIDFIGDDLYVDDYHPNTAGHLRMFKTICNSLANSSRLELADGIMENYVSTLGNISIGSGVVVSRYNATGKKVLFEINLTLAADTTISGLMSFTLPVASARERMIYGHLHDANGSYYLALGMLLADVCYIYVIGSAETYANFVATSAIVPFTWATGDTVNISGWYESV